MLQFKNRDAYVEWRAHWRRKLADVNMCIRLSKNAVRSHPGGSWRHMGAQSDLRGLKMQVRTLYMARMAVEEAYKARRAADPKKHNQQAKPW